MDRFQLAAAVIVLPLAAPAADLTVPTADAYKQVVMAMASQFEASTGHIPEKMPPATRPTR
jgi:hypothetical protein